MNCTKCGKKITTRACGADNISVYWTIPNGRKREPICEDCASDLLYGTEYTGLRLKFKDERKKARECTSTRS